VNEGSEATFTFEYGDKKRTKTIRVEMDRYLEMWYTGPEFTYQRAPEGVDAGLEFLHAKYKLETLDALKDAFIDIYGEFVKSVIHMNNAGNV
jgi:hypothetical protein